ncbi:MAG: 6-carboxytetrahydropterin synthase [Phycisphaerales bacterium]
MPRRDDPQPAPTADGLANPQRPCSLSRTVRLALSADGTESSLPPRDNPFAAWPSQESWAVHLEVDVVVAGVPDPTTGYLVDIGKIDGAVRAELLRPRLIALTSPAGLLRRLVHDLPARLACSVSRVRLRLGPRYSLEMNADAVDRVVLRQSFEFSASHRLHCPEYDEARNRALFGKCNNVNGHGHNYRLEVAVETPLIPTGTVAAQLGRTPTARLGATAALDAPAKETAAESLVAPSPGLRTIESIVRREVVDRLDHKHLNLDVPEFAGRNPSVENIAKTCYDLLVGPLRAAGGQLRTVTLWETEKTCCEYPAPR